MLMWSTEFPQEEGLYWFYGYQRGKWWGTGENRTLNKPDLMMVEVRKCANDFMYVANGQFMFESEFVEEPHFQKAVIPELPKLKG